MPTTMLVCSIHSPVPTAAVGVRMFSCSRTHMFTAVFDIEAHTGAIQLMLHVDYETKRVYSFEVVGVDGGRPSLSSSVRMNVRVTDVNDNAPTFAHGAYEAHVMDDAVKGTFITKLTVCSCE
jgi:hypothetical protein